jgi:class 3 adenylate cyclase
MDVPDTQYALRRDGSSVAYQVFGRGPINLVFCWGFISHLDLQWANYEVVRFYERLASFSRVIVFDKSGTGLSDPIDHVATLEDRVEDIGAVMDAANLERAVLFGESEAGPTAILFATMYPERVSGLVVFGSIVKGTLSEEDAEEMGIDAALVESKWAEMDDVIRDWGKGRSLELLAPSVADVALMKRGTGTLERSSVSPSMARALMGVYREIDITGILDAIRAPVLVLHRRDDWVPVQFGRYLASHVEGARYVELEGGDHAFFLGDTNAILEEAQRFLTGKEAPAHSDRALFTVLFTDIVDSTALAASHGDAAWRTILERHFEVASLLVAEFEGRVVKSTGDGVLAVFAGPARAIHCATRMLSDLGDLGVVLRAGIHTGECEVMGDDIGGIAVHVGARVCALAQGGEVLVSSTVKELVIGSGIEFSDRGRHELKGVPDTWHLFGVGGQSQVARLEPPSAQMTRGDRLMVRLARRAPGPMRAAGRLAGRGSG